MPRYPCGKHLRQLGEVYLSIASWLGFVFSKDMFMLNVPPVCLTWFLLSGCLSVKPGFLLLTHKLLRFRDVKQRAIMTATAFFHVSLPGACFPSSYNLDCF